MIFIIINKITINSLMLLKFILNGEIILLTDFLNSKKFILNMIICLSIYTFNKFIRLRYPGYTNNIKINK